MKKSRRKYKRKKRKCKVKISVMQKHLTSYGGLGLFALFFNKIKLIEAITNIFNIIEEKSNRTIPIYNRVIMFFLTVLIGGERFSHMNQLGNYKVIKEVFQINKICQHSSTLTRLFNKIKTFKQAVKINKSIRNYLNQLIPFKEIKSDWIGFDSTVLPKYGEQEGARKGYNPKKPGRPSYNPIIAFLNYSRYVVNLWNRSGNCKSGNNIINFFNEVYEDLKNKITINGIIGDSGFYIESFIKHLEKLKIKYVIRAVLYKNLQTKISNIKKKDWIEMLPGIDYNILKFKPDKWTKLRKYIVIRKEKTNNKKGQGKQLKLSFYDETIDKYEYYVFVTNSDDTVETLWEILRHRCDDENRIKELKDSYALEGFTVNSFYGNECSMLLRVLLYNIVLIFKRNFLNQQEQNQFLSTIRRKYLIVPAILGRSGYDYVLKIAVPTRSFKAKLLFIKNQINRFVTPINLNAMH